MPPFSIGVAIAGVAVSAASAGLAAAGTASANRAARRASQSFTKKAESAARLTREVNIPIQRAQAAQQREKVSRDTNLLLGQLVVSAAERGVLEAQSTDQGIQTILQGMSYNLSQINANLYMSEQQIVAQTQYPEIYPYQPQSVALSGMQGGLQGLSMGLQLGGMLFPPSAAPTPTPVQTGAWGGGSFTPSSGNIGGSGAWGGGVPQGPQFVGRPT